MLFASKLYSLNAKIGVVSGYFECFLHSIECANCLLGHRSWVNLFYFPSCE